MDTTTGGPSAPEGWYPDSTQPGLLRHWTGTAWTQEWTPAPDPQAATPGSPGLAAGAALDGSGRATPQVGSWRRGVSRAVAVVVALMGLERLVSGLLLVRTPDGEASGWAPIVVIVGLLMAVVGIVGVVYPPWVSFAPLDAADGRRTRSSWLDRLSPVQARMVLTAFRVSLLGIVIVGILTQLRR